MSKEVKRYSYGYVDDRNGNRYLRLIEKPDGNLVKHADYAALLAERDAMLNDPEFPPKYSRRLIAQLRAERNQLRDALVTARDWIDFSKGAVGGGTTILEEIDAALQGEQP